jgi:hypothetical protein
MPILLPFQHSNSAAAYPPSGCKNDKPPKLVIHSIMIIWFIKLNTHKNLWEDRYHLKIYALDRHGWERQIMLKVTVFPLTTLIWCIRACGIRYALLFECYKNFASWLKIGLSILIYKNCAHRCPWPLYMFAYHKSSLWTLISCSLFTMLGIIISATYERAPNITLTKQYSSFSTELCVAPTKYLWVSLTLFYPGIICHLIVCFQQFNWFLF